MLPTVTRSFALAIGQPCVPATVNFMSTLLTGLLSTVSRVAVPELTVGCDWSIVASSVGANVNVVVPPAPAW